MYVSLNSYLRERFDGKVYKLALAGGTTCPNRDGTVGTSGCIFCSEGGSGDFCPPANLPIDEQIELAKARVSAKVGEGKYIAYFQSFTVTYKPIEALRSQLEGAIAHPDIVAVSVATRPDCLPYDVIELLKELNKIKPIFVELGLQTIHSDTAKLIRRGWELPVFDKAVKDLRAAGVEVVVHVILGLPSEDEKKILETIDYVAHSDIQGIKLQLLHVLKDTELERMYNNREVSPLSMEQYVELLKKCVRRLPPNMVIHRLTGDGAKRLLVAPLWSADKKKVLNEINRKLKDVIQGEEFF